MKKATIKSVDLVQGVLDAAALRKRRPYRRASGKTTISLTLDNEIVEAFKSLGDGWRAKMIAALRDAAPVASRISPGM